MMTLLSKTNRPAQLLFIVFTSVFLCVRAQAQLLGEPPLAQHPLDRAAEKQKKQKRFSDLEWMWQYSPPPADGREHELIQDPNFLPFLHQYFTAPQSFWGPTSESNDPNPRDPRARSLADTAYDFLTIPGKVLADDNRYITATGAVRHRPTSRGLLFADLDSANPLVVFAAIDWIRDSKTTDDPAAEYNLWIFSNQPLPKRAGISAESIHLPPALDRSLIRWLAQPLPGSGIVQKISNAILVDPDGTPHQMAVPGATPAAAQTPQLPKRPSS